MKLIMTLGLPASGKSTWAKEYLTKNPNTIRINKDDLRAMLHNSVWSKGREALVLRTRDWLVGEGLSNGHDVIVDDTNLNPVHRQQLRNLALQYKAEFEIKDFADVPLEECIKRDSMRVNSVGVEVIKRMYNQYLKPAVSTVDYNPELKDCYIFDIDGTLAIKGERTPYEWAKVGNDLPNWPVIKTYKELKGVKKIIFSGRDSVCRKETMEWLDRYGIKYDLLVMREENDTTKDSIIKQGFYEANVKDKYNVLGIFDDRNQVVDMWRSLGLPCYQVAEGDF